MEVKKRFKGFTLWASVDAEGRRVYATSDDRDGLAVEPSQAVHYSQKAALEHHRYIKAESANV